jgi:hypothetical protein
MPVKVRKGTGAKPYKIVKRTTGEVVGASSSKKKADASAKVTNRAYGSRKR